MPLEPLHVAFQGWQNFYLLTGTAAATLTGLMFVAVTFGATLVKRETANSARAFLDPIYRHFAQVLLMACLTTIPILERGHVAVVLLAVGGLRFSGLHWLIKRYREAHASNGDVDLSDWLTAIVLPAVCHLSLCASAVGFVVGHPAAFAGLAIVTLALLLLGLYGAWELLVWMAVAVSDRARANAGTRTPDDQ